jgi:hypothetical protein
VSITNYAELQTAIQNWSNKTNVAAKVPDFITLAEAKFNRRLRTRWQETTLAPTVIDSDYHIAIPATCAAVKSLWRDADPTWRIEQKDLSYVVEHRDQGGLPKYYAWDGSNWTFDGSADDITGTYFLKIPSLSAGVNWLITSHPDLYLWGGLEQCAIYLRDIEGASAWKAMAEALIDELNGVSVADQLSGGTLVARTRTQLSSRPWA